MSRQQRADAAPVTFCDRCGQRLDAGDHDACRRARLLEPPRFCARCRRRMVVQVLPTGWQAICGEHGMLSSLR